MSSLISRLTSPSGAFWIFMQHGAGRFAMGVKFLILARILGPEGVGLIAVGLLAIAVAEAFSELGLLQAVVQRRKELMPEQLSAVWGWQILRSVLVAASTFLLAQPAAQFFSVPEAGPIFNLVAGLLLLRGTTNLSMTMATREMKLKRVSIFNALFFLLDAFVGIITVFLTNSVLAMFAAMIAVEIMRWVTSYVAFPRPPRPRLSRDASTLAAFGKWIWINNILTFALNQTDKFLLVKIAGLTGLGTYQLAQRFAQMTIADSGTALSQYLFPKLSNEMRINKENAVRLTTDVLMITASAGMLALIALNALAEPILISILGDTWIGAAPIFKILIHGMYGGLLTAVLVPYVKSEGKAWIVTAATLLQLMVFLGLIFVLEEQGVEGIALAVSAAVWVATLAIFLGAVSFTPLFGALFFAKWKMLLALPLCQALAIHTPALWWISAVTALSLFLLNSKKILRTLK